MTDPESVGGVALLAVIMVGLVLLRTAYDVHRSRRVDRYYLTLFYESAREALRSAAHRAADNPTPYDLELVRRLHASVLRRREIRAR